MPGGVWASGIITRKLIRPPGAAIEFRGKTQLQRRTIWTATLRLLSKCSGCRIRFCLDLQARRSIVKHRSILRVFAIYHVVVFTLAALSAVFFILPRSWFFSRHQPDEIPG